MSLWTDYNLELPLFCVFPGAQGVAAEASQPSSLPPSQVKDDDGAPCNTQEVTNFSFSSFTVSLTV